MKLLSIFWLVKICLAKSPVMTLGTWCSGKIPFAQVVFISNYFHITPKLSILPERIAFSKKLSFECNDCFFGICNASAFCERLKFEAITKIITVISLILQYENLNAIPKYSFYQHPLNP